MCNLKLDSLGIYCLMMNIKRKKRELLDYAKKKTVHMSNMHISIEKKKQMHWVIQKSKRQHNSLGKEKRGNLNLKIPAEHWKLWKSLKPWVEVSIFERL